MALRGHRVYALVRRAGSEPQNSEALVGDLADRAVLKSLVEQAQPDCVVHLAAEIASQRSGRKVRAVNVNGTRNLLDACVAQVRADGEEEATVDGPRFVFASTVVTGEARGELLTEEEPLPVRTPYGRSKQEGEQLVRESGLPSIVMRPSHVYGPGGWFADELVARLRQPGRLAVVGAGENLWDVVHIDDVVGAFVLAAQEAPAGATYHVVDDEPISYYDFMALTAEALGVGRPRHVPKALARLLAGGNAVDAVVRSARSSNRRIKRELGWSPRYASAAEGVPAAVAALER
jgi:nucleoside-diphosphate-sugar epimerase